MLDWTSLAIFVSAATVLVLLPGPNTIYIITRSVQQGWSAGIVSSLGVQVGTVFHLLAAAFGVSALIVASSSALTIIRVAGAVYLIGLGIKTLLAKGDATAEPAVERASRWRIFWQGAVVNLLNPKTILFLFAFLPQFIDPARGSVVAQTLALGGLLCLLGTASDVVYSVAAGSIGHVLRSSPKLARRQQMLAGCVYIGLGAATALTGPRSR